MARLIGFYAELEPRRPDIYSRSIMNAISDTPGPHESEIAQYLEHGAILLDIAESCRDVVSGDRYISGCSSILTDGLWVWRLDLSYYLRRYHLKLDSDFSDHAADLIYKIPDLSRDEILAVAQHVAFDILKMRA